MKELGKAFNERKETNDILVHFSVYKESSSKVHYLLEHIRSQDREIQMLKLKRASAGNSMRKRKREPCDGDSTSKGEKHYKPSNDSEASSAEESTNDSEFYSASEP